jgi:alcohol dehydrogenase (cytochrome c)
VLSTPAVAADVTPERLVNADREPGNWLMNHRTYDAQRYSPLDKINRGIVKNLKLAYAIALGGTAVNENLEATPLAEDGFRHLTDQWGGFIRSTRDPATSVLLRESGESSSRRP